MMRNSAYAALAALGLCLASCNQAPPVDEKEKAALQALVDRAEIENLAMRYVSHLGGKDPAAFGAYYTEDGVFDVNGAVYKGRKAIGDLYMGMRAARPADVPVDADGLNHMVLTNPVIEVTGDTAKASFIWTGYHNPKDPTQPPVMTEQGREYDLYVKVDGKWLIKKRTVIADSFVPKGMLNTWKRRLDYDITKD
jgi:uncharacterized protein (TIGR02246 family)